MDKLDGETFEGVSIRDCPAHSLLELLVTHGQARGVLQLIGCQRRAQDVAQLVVPVRAQAQVLQWRRVLKCDRSDDVSWTLQNTACRVSPGPLMDGFY